MKQSIILIFVITLILSVLSCSESDKKMGDQMENEFRNFVAGLETELAQLNTNQAIAYWNASIESNEDNWGKYTDADIKLNEFFSDTSKFSKLKEFKESGKITNDTLKRQLDILYRNFLGKQIDKEKLNKLSAMNSDIENKFTKFRAEFDGKKYSDNEIEGILKESDDNKKLKKAWLASKKIGPIVEDDIKKIVNLRNEIAKEIGYDNYHTMSLELNGQNPEEVSALFDELDELTRETYSNLKNDIDNHLTELYGVKKEKLMPWHYQNRYFQEAPQIYEVDMDKYYENQDIVELNRNYFNSLNLEVNDIIERSDLYEKEGKNQHAYCINIDRNKKDVRMLCNIAPSTRWMETMLHETGHAVYEKYYSDDLPYTLKEPAHIFATEAIAMLFGRLANNPKWMMDMNVIDENQKNEIQETAHKILRLQQLVFSRWAQVMYRFEKEMYANPNQDLNSLWWNLVEKYQMIKKPENRDMPDWATKIHIASFPCYYHNYLLGELLASQLQHYIIVNILKKDENAEFSFKDSKTAGEFLRNKVFAVGSLYQWNDMIEKATGEKLTAIHYANQFVK